MTTTGRCPYCGRLGTGEPCNPCCEPDERAGISSTPAHAKKRHPLAQAHSAVVAPSGTRVYVVCGWWGCPQRLEVDAAVWEAEQARRQGTTRAADHA